MPLSGVDSSNFGSLSLLEAASVWRLGVCFRCSRRPLSTPVVHFRSFSCRSLVIQSGAVLPDSFTLAGELLQLEYLFALTGAPGYSQ